MADWLPTRPGRLMVVVMATMAAVACDQQPASPTNPTPAVTTTALSAEHRQNTRRDLDNTIWQSEVEAQQLERPFVELWDAIRSAGQKFDVLATFDFDTITLPAATNLALLEHGIRVGNSRNAGATITRDNALALLSSLEQSGYRIAQTEWHHAAMVRTEAGNRRSTVNYAIHAERPTTDDRVILRGSLHVTWAQDTQLPRATHLDASDMALLHRTGAPVFKEVIQFEPNPASTRPSEIEPILLADLDQNGLTDIVLAGANQVQYNDGSGRFRSEPLCTPLSTRIDAALIADFTGDGVADLLITGAGTAPMLYTAKHDDQFTAPRVLDSVSRMESPSVITAGDIDRDGDLDVWIAQYKPPYVGGQMPTPFYDANDGFASFLLINDGSGYFVEATDARGLDAKRHRRTYSASFVDLDHDDDQDLIVVSDFAGIDIHLNDGNGHFTDATAEWFGEGHNTFGMSHTIADINGDGLLDLLVVGMSSTTARRLDQLGLGREDAPDYRAMRSVMGYGNRLYLGTPGGPLTLAPFTDMIARTGWSWGSADLDIENDGDRDLLVVNGHSSGDSCADYCTTFWRHDLYDADSQSDPEANRLFQLSLAGVNSGRESWNGYEKNALFVNGNGASMTNAAYLLGASFEYDARAALASDLDNDGRSDLLVVERTRRPNQRDVLHVYRNQWPRPGNWIGVRLPMGRMALGTTITIECSDGSIQTHAVISGDSYRSQHDAIALFGLGSRDAVAEIRVRWPAGNVTIITAPAINQYHVLKTEVNE